MKRHMLDTNGYNCKTAHTSAEVTAGDGSKEDDGVRSFAIFELPNELLSKILLNMSLKDLFLSGSYVCKRWRSMITSDSFLKELLLRDFDAAAVRAFLLFPDSLSRFKEILRSSSLFYPSGLMLDSRSDPHELRFSSKIHSLEQFVDSVRALEDKSWQSLSHCFVNGGFCNHYWYWLINMSNLLTCPEIISVLMAPFAIGNCGFKIYSKEPLYLYNKDLEFLEEPVQVEDPAFSCWIVQSYPPGLHYVALQVSDDFCVNEDLPLRIFWPSQIAPFEQRLGRLTMKRQRKRLYCFATGCYKDDNNNNALGFEDDTSDNRSLSSVESGMYDNEHGRDNHRDWAFCSETSSENSVSLGADKDDFL